MFSFIRNNVFVQSYKDIVNFFRFKNQIKREKKNPMSKFNAYQLKTNWLGNCIYTQKVLTETQMMADEKQKYIFLLDLTRPENNYFTNDLFWSEYLTFDTYNFTEEDTEMPSNTYGIVWKFIPYTFNTPKFYKALMLVGVILVTAFLLLTKFGIL